LKAQIDYLFPNNACIHSSSLSTIRIKEINQVAQIIYDENIQEHFKITNENKNRIGILVIDGCLKFIPNQRKCDFAFWNNHNFYFVEIKAIQKIKYRKKYKKDIIEQLEETIQYFLNNAVDFGNRIIYAVGGWAYYPTKPLISTKMQEQSFRFKQQYNVELIEGNSVNI